MTTSFFGAFVGLMSAILLNVDTGVSGGTTLFAESSYASTRALKTDQITQPKDVGDEQNASHP